MIVIIFNVWFNYQLNIIRNDKYRFTIHQAWLVAPRLVLRGLREAPRGKQYAQPTMDTRRAKVLQDVRAMAAMSFAKIGSAESLGVTQ